MTNSKVEKGKRFEKKIAQYLQDSGLDLRAHREDGSGSGLKKGDIRSSIPFLIEAKNSKSVSKGLLKWIDQAKDQATKGFKWREKWALVFRDPRTPEHNSEDYVVIDFHQFIELLKRYREPLTKEPDRTLKYKLERLRQSAQEVIKEIE
jgi:Holliday junction resolvase